jgi:hypothetical protein
VKTLEEAFTSFTATETKGTGSSVEGLADALVDFYAAVGQPDKA